MTHPNARTARIRIYHHEIHDLRRSFRARAGVDMARFLKRGALAALPRAEGWHMLVVAIERTREGEPVAPVLDALARRLMQGGPDFAAALAVTADGARAALAVSARDAARIARARAVFAAIGQR
jgi:hypothetical protein